MTAFMSWKNFAIRLPGSPENEMAKPNKIENTMTCSILPSTTAAKGLEGKILIIDSFREGISLGMKGCRLAVTSLTPM